MPGVWKKVGENIALPWKPNFPWSDLCEIWRQGRSRRLRLTPKIWWQLVNLIKSYSEKRVNFCIARGNGSVKKCRFHGNHISRHRIFVKLCMLREGVNLGTHPKFCDKRSIIFQVIVKKAYLKKAKWKQYILTITML